MNVLQGLYPEGEIFSFFCLLSNIFEKMVQEKRTEGVFAYKVCRNL
jgi:hypothetical protein